MYISKCLSLSISSCSFIDDLKLFGDELELEEWMVIIVFVSIARRGRNFLMTLRASEPGNVSNCQPMAHSHPCLLSSPVPE